MIELLGEVLRVVEHTGAKVGLYLNARTEKADTPEKSAEYHRQHDIKHRSTDMLNEKGHIEGYGSTVYLHLTKLKAVDHHTIKLGYLKLEHINQKECQYTE